MEIESLKNSTDEKMQKAIDGLLNEFKKVRTGRAQVSMLDNVKVDYYGNISPLNQVASISCPDARSFLITPWESSVLKLVESALVKSDIGMAPINDGKTIRMKLPDVTEERRKDLAKAVKKLVEDAKISIRKFRKDANDEIKLALKDKIISEDDNKNFTEQIQKVTDKYVVDIDKLGQDKEKDILTV